MHRGPTTDRGVRKENYFTGIPLSYSLVFSCESHRLAGRGGKNVVNISPATAIAEFEDEREKCANVINMLMC